MDRALEAVEDVSRAGRHHFEGLVVVVAADFALRHGEILLTDELLGREPGDADDLDSLDLDGTEDGEPDDDDDDAATGDSAVPHGPVGDSEILDDLGVGEKELRALDADDALNTIAESLGASEVLETVR